MKEVRIELLRGYFIEVDEMNHTLKQRYIGEVKDTKEKKESERLIGYYPNVRACLERIVDLIAIDVCEHEQITMNDYIKALDKSLKEVKAFYDRMKEDEY